MKLLYSSQDVCEMLGVNIKVVYRFVKERKLGYVKLHNKGFHFTPDQVEDLIRLLTVPAKTPARKAAPKPQPTDEARSQAGKQSVDKATHRKEMREWQ